MKTVSIFDMFEWQSDKVTKCMKCHMVLCMWGCDWDGIGLFFQFHVGMRIVLLLGFWGPSEEYSFGSLARRALEEEAEWIPDEEETEILVRAINRLRQRLSVDSMSEQQKRLERLAEKSSNSGPRASSQLDMKPVQPLHTRCSNPLIVAEYQIAKGVGEEESPPSPRRRGILRASSITPVIPGTDFTQLPMNSTTASAAFGGFSFAEGESPDSKTSSSPASPRSPRSQPLRLPMNLKPRMSTVSIADEEELVEFDENGSRSSLTPRKSASLSESSTTALETARSSVARSSVFLKSPRHSLANMFRWKRSEAGHHKNVNMGNCWEHCGG